MNNHNNLVGGSACHISLAGSDTASFKRTRTTSFKGSLGSNPGSSDPASTTGSTDLVRSLCPLTGHILVCVLFSCSTFTQ